MNIELILLVSWLITSILLGCWLVTKKYTNALEEITIVALIVIMFFTSLYVMGVLLTI